MALHEYVEGTLSNAFKKYGRFLSRYPWKILITAFVATGILGLGLLFQEEETNLEYLYTPENSRAVKDRRRVEALFPDESGSDFYPRQSATLGVYGDVIVIDETQGENVLTSEVLNEYLSLDEYITNISVTVGDIEYKYYNVCAIQSDACYVSGIQNLLNGTDVNGFLADELTYPVDTRGAAPVYLQTILGGVKVSERSTVQSAEALRVRYYLRTDGEYEDISLLWEKEFLAGLSEWNGTTSIQIAYSTSDSLSSELNSGLSGDIVRFSITFALMITYASIVCGTLNCITDRAFLACTGVFAAALAILASYGFCSYIGVKDVSVVGIMPFLIVGIGIDDMFLLMSGWLETKPSSKVADRVSTALSISAVSITITSLTDLLAFTIGATNVFPAVRNFCIYTGFAVIWCYLMQLMVFGSFMVFHTKRVKDRKHCVTRATIPDEESCKVRGKVWYCNWIVWCRGVESKSKEKDEEDRSIFERFSGPFASFVERWPVKIAVLVVFAGYLGVSIWGAMQLQQGLLLNNLVPQNSYLHSYLTLNNDYFDANGPIITVVMDGPLNYWEEGVQGKINDLLTNIENDPDIVANSRISWLDSFSSFHNGSPPSGQSAFIISLQSFLDSASRLRNDVDISNVTVSVTASRFYVPSVGLTSSTDQGQMMLRVRKITDSSDLPAFAYTGAFIYYEQYVQVLPSTLLTVGCAVAAMFVVCIFFIPHPLCVIYVTITMVMILVGLFGFMHFWGLSLSSITMIHIVISIGFSVDFCAHVSHAFMKADGKDRNERVTVALSRVAVPILNGGISTLLGVIMLVDASSYVFQSFFRIMVLTILFGVAHALLFLPVVLSLIGPSKKSTNGGNNETNVEEINMNMEDTVSPNDPKEPQMEQTDSAKSEEAMRNAQTETKIMVQSKPENSNESKGMEKSNSQKSPTEPKTGHIDPAKSDESGIRNAPTETKIMVQSKPENSNESKVMEKSNSQKSPTEPKTGHIDPAKSDENGIRNSPTEPKLVQSKPGNSDERVEKGEMGRDNKALDTQE